jgi:DNA-binding transcriptional ArsR family regulator
MADIFDVVADPTRRDLLQLLLAAYVSVESEAGELSVSEIVEQLGATQPTVSKHLKVLRDHGLVSVREDGQHRYYSLDATPLEDLEDWLIPFLSADFDPSRVDPDNGDGATALAAWAGGEVGQRVGRVVADSTYKARSVVQDAQKQVTRSIHRITGR